MNCRNRSDHRRGHLFVGLKPRRLQRPAVHRTACRSDQLARRLCALAGDHLCRRDRGRVSFAARAQLRALGRPACFEQADARPSAQQAADRHLRSRLRCAVQFHLHLHLSVFISLRRPTISPRAGSARSSSLISSAPCSRPGSAGRSAGSDGVVHGRVIASGPAGIALTLAPSLPLIVAGFALRRLRPDMPGRFNRLCHVTAKAGRSSAVGLCHQLLHRR